MDKKHVLKVTGIAVATGVVLWLGFTYWNYRKLQSANAGTQDQTDASMSASVAPGNVSIGQLASMGLTTNNSDSAIANNTFASFTPQNIQTAAYTLTNDSMIPASSWEYDPNYHIPYGVPTLPTGFQAPTVSTEQGAYISGGTYAPTGIMLESA
jgi:hypothetical protein